MNNKNVLNYVFGNGSLSLLPSILKDKRSTGKYKVLYFIDSYFKIDSALIDVNFDDEDIIFYHDTKLEPTTEYIDNIMDDLYINKNKICAVVGIGGGSTMDVSKAVSNLITNKGSAEDYQGWNLVRNPGMYKIAIPTLSGTGAEATRTCVMTNKKTGLKLGMNSDFTVFDQIIMDPELTSSVPKDQFFYTGMDAYIHCIEALNGSHRNAIGDAYSAQTIHLCKEVFGSDNMMSNENRSKMMVASYLGGCAIATSYVGVVHPFSAGLSVVLGIHHCIANCITMRAMKEFYPVEYDEFWEMCDRQKVFIPKGVCDNLADDQYNKLYESTIIHEKPLVNAIGNNYKSILTKDKVIEIFKKM